MHSLKKQRLKEYQPMTSSYLNTYSLVSIRKNTKEQKVLLQNQGENKKDRQRPEANAKTDASLFKLPKQSGFASGGNKFGSTWRDKHNGGVWPTVRQIANGMVWWLVDQN